MPSRDEAFGRVLIGTLRGSRRSAGSIAFTVVPVGKTLLIAGACALVPLIGNVVASFVTESTGANSWLVVPVVGVVVAMATALIQAYGSASEPAPQPTNTDRGQQPPRVATRIGCTGRRSGAGRLWPSYC
jgi:hypothetical protein